jgi:hypothetical protein
MQECKPIKVPIFVGVNLSTYQCPKTHEDKYNKFHVPYASVVGSLVYAMVYTRPSISHAMGVLSRYMSTSWKDHWETIKRVFKYLCDTTTYGL